MVTRPHLPEAAMDAVRSLCLQALASLDDDPQEKVGLQLRERHVPPPFNRSGYGKAEAIQAMTIDELRAAWRERCRPRPAILGIAGAVDPDAVVSQLETLLGTWTGESSEPRETAPAARGTVHVQQDTAQVHLALAFDAPREADEHSMVERLACSVLGGSTSGRLFTEVRQKRSLCYSVSASYNAGRDRGAVSLYAGTTPERAQETLDVCVEQIERMKRGVTAAEFHRATIGLKSRLVMQGESTPARARSLARDAFALGRPRDLEEVAGQVDAVTLDQLNAYLSGRQFGPFTVASIGPVEVAVSAKLSSMSLETMMFQPGTRVRVTQQMPHRDKLWSSTVEGVVKRYRQAKTGSWFAHAKDDKLWLDRLELELDDGEIVVLNLDQYTVVEAGMGTRD
jgi:predicted Zn-dependent peptidase